MTFFFYPFNNWEIRNEIKRNCNFKALKKKLRIWIKIYDGKEGVYISNISWQNARSIAHRVARCQGHFSCTISPLDGYSVSCPRETLYRVQRIEEKLKKNKSNLPVKIFFKTFCNFYSIKYRVSLFSLYRGSSTQERENTLIDLFSLECSSAVQRQGRVIVEVAL